MKIKPSFGKKPLSDLDLLPIVIDDYNIRKADRVIIAINHDLRQQIIKSIRENKGITVTELYTSLKISQPEVSLHLKILRRTGILNSVRKGKFVFYTINATRVIEINAFAKKFL